MTLPPLLYTALILAAGGPMVYWIGRLLDADTRKSPGPSWAQPAALVGLLAAWVPFGVGLHQFWVYGLVVSSFGDISFHSDALSYILAGTALGLGTLVAIYSRALLEGAPSEARYYGLLLILIACITGLGLTTDLFHLWLWFEAMSLSSYFLVGFHVEDSAALEAAVKYLAQSAVGSVLAMLGIALVLLQTGSLDLLRLAQAPINNTVNTAAGLCLIGFGVKSALVPLHTWLADAHSQAPSGISALLSGVVIEAGLVAALRVIAPLSYRNPGWGWLFVCLGSLNILVGNLLALRQLQVKRMLAYSSISQVGYMVLGLGLAAALGNPMGAQGAFLHLINHGIMKGLAFLAAGVLIFALQRQSPLHHVLTIEDLSGAAARYPWVAFCFSLAVLGLAGLPPLAGFMSKWQIFVSGAMYGSGLVLAFVVFAALNSVLSLSYYVPVVNMLYRKQPSPLLAGAPALPRSATAPLLVLAAGIVLLGIWPAWLAPITAAAGSLLAKP
jgi:proton-translocating NADH-quinone oxidoreductase chain N